MSGQPKWRAIRKSSGEPSVDSATGRPREWFSEQAARDWMKPFGLGNYDFVEVPRGE